MTKKEGVSVSIDTPLLYLGQGGKKSNVLTHNAQGQKGWLKSRADGVVKRVGWLKGWGD